ncbi:MAG: LON peptidase substrate-binding domain-containing protein [Proteobacteria bacterium]|uniref:LON peptidase substrate-binding domain-containing protein n=1 Tax=Rudaea sp. TaxID=2136325 RepID=UPI00322060B7|nr:LON peptidase substrate-binding domain-containing protein [Pseudomonadota bacterium]
MDIPLFPLHTVLFPGGEIALRIFEPRYLDMVRDCARGDSPFGVCLILDGNEVGEPATPAAVGTLARIVDFSTTPDGLLGIRALGTQRFRLARSRVRDNGAAHGEVEPWPDEARVAMPVEFQLLATILERLLEKTGGTHAKAARENFDDAGWVGFRLAELLPLDNRERQLLLQMTAPLERLAQLMHTLPRFQSG